MVVLAPKMELDCTQKDQQSEMGEVTEPPVPRY